MTDALELTQLLPQSPPLAYRMWTVPTLMRRWLFASDSGTLVTVEADPVVGGGFRILELNDGLEIDHFGQYLLADPPHRLRFTLDVPQHFSESTEITITITPDGDGSLLRFRQTGIDLEKTRPFWRDMLIRLATVTAEES